MVWPPFQNGSTAFSKWIVWSAFENVSITFWKWVGRLVKMVRWKCRPPFENYTVAFWKWFGRLFKIGRPPFQNYMVAFSKWVDRFFKIIWPPFENGSLKMSTTEDSLAAQSVGFWRFLCLQIRPSFVNRRLLNIVEPTKTANEAAHADIGEVDRAANLSMGKWKENAKTFMS